MKKFLVILLILVVVIAGGVYYTLSTSKSIDVAWTEADYQSYLQKMNLENVPAVDNSDNTVTSGTSKPYPLNATFTNAEISAMLSKENEKTEGPVKDIKVRFLPNNELEATFVTSEKIKKYIANNEIIEKYAIAEKLIANRPVYVKLKLEKESEKTVTLDLQDVQVGRIGIPESAKAEAENVIQSALNDHLQSLSNFSMEELNFDENSAHFNGNLQSTPRKLE